MLQSQLARSNAIKQGLLGVSPATVSRVLKRLGLNKLKALEPAEPARRSAEVVRLAVRAELQACNESGTCLPPETLDLALHF